MTTYNTRTTGRVGGGGQFRCQKTPPARYDWILIKMWGALRRDPVRRNDRLGAAFVPRLETRHFTVHCSLGRPRAGRGTCCDVTGRDVDIGNMQNALFYALRSF